MQNVGMDLACGESAFSTNQRENNHCFTAETRNQTALKYTAPKLEGKARELVTEEGTKATNREERVHMLIKAAFPEAPDAGEQPSCQREAMHTGESTSWLDNYWPGQGTRAPLRWGRR